MLIPNITIKFYNFLSKNAQKDIFGLKFKDFFFVRNLFKLTTQNYWNKAFLVPKLKLFVLYGLSFHKFEGAHSIYKNFLKILV